MLLEIIILILAFPTGYLIAWMAKDELVSGRKWFKILIGLFAIIGVVFYFIQYYAGFLTSAFIIIISYVSLVKSKDRK